MSKKITFEELIDSIAEQSGKPKQFVHDFIKDLVTNINESLDKDGNINIAGLGKFELQKMDEREGYNPQTEEKITIPAHNKIVFNPYKDLRELVNAPYEHMEAEIIEEDETETSSKEEPQEHDGGQAVFPPSTGTAQEDSEDESEEVMPQADDSDQEFDIAAEDPFDLEGESKGSYPLSVEDETGDKEDDQEEDGLPIDAAGIEKEAFEEPDETKSGEIEEPSAEEPVDESIAKQNEREKTVFPAGDEKDEDLAKEQSQEKEKIIPASSQSVPKFKNRRHHKKESNNSIWIIAAAFIILLLAAGFWYFLGVPQGTAPGSLADRPAENVQPANSNREAEDDATSNQNQNNEGEDTPPADNRQAQTNQQRVPANSQTGTPQNGNNQADNRTKEITVARGQTLWGLADDEYRNPYLWPWIYDTNKSEIDNPDIIMIGQLLDIPLRSGANNELSGSDSLQVALGYVETYRWYKENKLENAKFYLYAAKKYHSRVFEHTDASIDEADLAFANRAQ